MTYSPRKRLWLTVLAGFVVIALGVTILQVAVVRGAPKFIDTPLAATESDRLIWIEDHSIQGDTDHALTVMRVDGTIVFQGPDGSVRHLAPHLSVIIGSPQSAFALALVDAGHVQKFSLPLSFAPFVVDEVAMTNDNNLLVRGQGAEQWHLFDRALQTWSLVDTSIERRGSVELQDSVLLSSIGDDAAPQIPNSWVPAAQSEWRDDQFTDHKFLLVNPFVGRKKLYEYDRHTGATRKIMSWFSTTIHHGVTARIIDPGRLYLIQIDDTIGILNMETGQLHPLTTIPFYLRQFPTYSIGIL